MRLFSSADGKTREKGVLIVEFVYPEFTPCQARVTVGDSGLCCVCVTSFERLLTPLLVHFDAKKMPGTFRIKPLRIKKKIRLAFL